MTKKILSVLLPLFLLSACGSTKVVTEIQYVTLREELPPLSHPTPLSLVPFEYDYPRDLDAELKVKSTEACLRVSEEDYTEAFWQRCGEYPLDKNSNLFLGFDNRNFNQSVLNWNLVREQLRSYKERIDLENARREKIIEDNRAIREETEEKEKE